MSPQEMVGELMAKLHPGAMVAAAVVVAEVIVDGERPTAYVLWDDGAAPWCHEGLARLAVRKIESRTNVCEGP